MAMPPEPPYYAVIFTSVRTAGDQGYAATAARMVELAAAQPGFLGADSARNDVGITVSYWRDLAAIRAWREHPEHRAAIAQAGAWYAHYSVRVAYVERAWGSESCPA